MPSRISFDVVVEKDSQPYYWEFHEEQHRRLTVSRVKKVYAIDGSSIEVPRYVQRLVRDVWRAKYFSPYTIIWSDWFALHKSRYKPELADGYCELYLPGRFSFKQFCSGLQP